MSFGILFGRFKKRVFEKLYQTEMINIEADTVHSMTKMLLNMEDEGYVEFLNPKTGENVDFDSAITLYMEQLRTEMKGS